MIKISEKNLLAHRIVIGLLILCTIVFGIMLVKTPNDLEAQLLQYSTYMPTGTFAFDSEGNPNPKILIINIDTGPVSSIGTYTLNLEQPLPITEEQFQPGYRYIINSSAPAPKIGGTIKISNPPYTSSKITSAIKQ